MNRETILILDGLGETRSAVKPIVKKMGYKTRFMKNSEKCLRVYEELKPRIILIDINTEGSMELFKKIRTTNEEDTEVILFIGGDTPYCPESGAIRYLRKPFETKDLICSIMEAEDKLSLKDEKNRYYQKLKEYSENLQRMVQEKTSELTRANERLKALSVTDDLTGLNNRRFFFEILENDINQSLRHGHPLSVLLLDIDNFKSVNDRFGHFTGDEVLMEFAKLLRKNTRRGDTVARFGGEEFAVILSHTAENGSLMAAEILRKKLQAADFSNIGKKISITVSIGVAEFDRDFKDAEEILSRADIALYGAKSSGRNTVCYLPVKSKTPISIQTKNV